MLEKKEIQGVVVSGYGRHRFSSFRLYTFADGSGRAGLSSLLGSGLISFAAGEETGEEETGHRLNLAFTCMGLELLGLDAKATAMFPHEFRQGLFHPDRAAKLGDTGLSAPVRWEFGREGKDPPLHALAMVYARDGASLEARVAEVDGRLEGWRLIHELPCVLPKSDREPFGFRDGIAKVPLEGWKHSVAAGQRPVKAGEFILGYADEFGSLPPSPTLRGDPIAEEILPPAPDGSADFGRNGSYLVYRKLSQDVEGFWNYVGENARRMLGRDGLPERKWLAAKMVGRWPNGNPLTLDDYRENEGRALSDDKLDDFNYHAADAEGKGCPFGSHVRRSHPRDSLAPDPEESLRESARHRLIRRGRVYWTPGPGEAKGPIQIEAPSDNLPAGAPDRERFPYDENVFLEPATVKKYGQEHGLAFIAINASLRRQFEFIQQSWINNPNFEGLRNNRDPVSGNNHDDVLEDSLRSESRSVPEDSRMRIPASPAPCATGPLPRFVHMRGGGYFFLPSQAAMRYLAALAAGGEAGKAGRTLAARGAA